MDNGIKQYIIKSHARFEMARRQITEEQVASVLSTPGQILSSSGNRKIFQARLKVEAKEYIFRVFVDMDRSPPEVVTVYRTSKIRKYWR